MVQQSVANSADEWDKAAEGLAGLNEYIGEITQARFMVASEAYGKPASFGESCVIVLETTVESAIDPADFPHETTKIILSVGKIENWTILDGGLSIKNSKGGGLGNSKYQLFIARTTKELKVPIKERGVSPFTASAWTGLRFHFKREAQPIPKNLIREDGPTESYTMLPIQWMQNTMPPLVAASATVQPAQ